MGGFALMINFHGTNKKKNYFEGWYFKHQKENNTISFIPGININEKEEKTAFIQVITNSKSYNIHYPYSDFSVSKDTLNIKIHNNNFSKDGIEIDIDNKDIKIKGKVEYGEFVPIKYDIMGPFSILPFMECNHGVISLRHKLKGILKFQNEIIDLNNGVGYVEKDWGSSFPKTYLWTQCNSFKDKDCSIMVSIADIPFMGMNFKGCIAVVYYKGKEYRLATYNGVRILRYNSKALEIKKGKYKLKIDINERSPQKLLAPSNGNMSRTIHENASCSGTFTFYEGNKVIFNISSENVSFEYVH